MTSIIPTYKKALALATATLLALPSYAGIDWERELSEDYLLHYRAGIYGDIDESNSTYHDIKDRHTEAAAKSPSKNAKCTSLDYTRPLYQEVFPSDEFPEFNQYVPTWEEYSNSTDYESKSFWESLAPSNASKRIFHETFGGVEYRYLSNRRALVGDECTINKLIKSVGVGSWVKNLGNVTNEDVSDFGSFNSVVSADVTVGPLVAVRDMGAYYAAGTQAGFCIVASSGSVGLSLDVINVMTIGFYRDGEYLGTKTVSEGQNAGGITLSLVKIPGSNDASIFLTATSDWVFDEISLDRAGGVQVNLGDLMKIKYAFVGSAQQFTITNHNIYGTTGNLNPAISNTTFYDIFEENCTCKGLHKLTKFCQEQGTISEDERIVFDYAKGWNPFLLGIPFPMLKNEVQDFTNCPLVDDVAAITPIIAAGYQGGVKFMLEKKDINNLSATNYDNVFEAGTEVGFKYNFGSALTLDVGSWIRVILFDRRGNKVQEETVSGTVLGLGVGSGGDGTCCITSSVPFSGAEIRFHTVLSVNLGAMGVYYAFVNEPPEIPHHCDIKPRASTNVCVNQETLQLYSASGLSVTWSICENDGNPNLKVTENGYVTGLSWAMTDPVTGEVVKDANGNIMYETNDNVYIFKAETADGCVDYVTINMANFGENDVEINVPIVDTEEVIEDPADNNLQATLKTHYSISDEIHGSSGSLISTSQGAKEKENILLTGNDMFDKYAYIPANVSLASNQYIIGVKKSQTIVHDDGSETVVEAPYFFDGSTAEHDMCIGFVVEATATVLNLSALQFLQIRCYDNSVATSTGEVVETYRALIKENNAVSAGIGGSNKTEKIRYSIRVPRYDSNGDPIRFDEFQLWTSGVLNLQTTQIRIYYAFYDLDADATENPLYCGAELLSNAQHHTRINADDTSYGSGVTVANVINNLSFLVDDDEDSYCMVENTVTVGSGLTIAVHLGRTLDYRHQLGLLFSEETYAANVSVGEWLTLKTYYNGVATGEEFTKWSVVGAKVGGYGDKNYIIVQPQQTYDEVRIEVGKVVSALQVLKLYGLFIRGDVDNDGIPDCMDQESCEVTITNIEPGETCVGQPLVITGKGPVDNEYYMLITSPDNDPSEQLYNAVDDAEGTTLTAALDEYGNLVIDGERYVYDVTRKKLDEENRVIEEHHEFYKEGDADKVYYYKVYIFKSYSTEYINPDDTSLGTQEVITTTYKWYQADIETVLVSDLVEISATEFASVDLSQYSTNETKSYDGEGELMQTVTEYYKTETSEVWTGDVDPVTGEDVMETRSNDVVYYTKVETRCWVTRTQYSYYEIKNTDDEGNETLVGYGTSYTLYTDNIPNYDSYTGDHKEVVTDYDALGNVEKVTVYLYDDYYNELTAENEKRLSWMVEKSFMNVTRYSINVDSDGKPALRDVYDSEGNVIGQEYDTYTLDGLVEDYDSYTEVITEQVNDAVNGEYTTIQLWKDGQIYYIIEKQIREVVYYETQNSEETTVKYRSGEHIHFSTDEKGEFSVTYTPSASGLHEVGFFSTGNQLLHSATFWVHPLRTTWLKKTVNASWDNWSNWTEGTPYCCTDVIIPSDCDYYPVLMATYEETETVDGKDINYDEYTAIDVEDVKGDEFCVHYIHFEPEAYVNVASNLNYVKAWAEWAPAPNRYYTFSAPFKQMYTGDMFMRYNTAALGAEANGDYFTRMTSVTWATENDESSWENNRYPGYRFNPQVFHRMFQEVGYDKLMKDGSMLPTTTSYNGKDYKENADWWKASRWSHNFNAVNTSYELGRGYNVWVDNMEVDTSAVPLFYFRFPKEHDAYMYYSDYDQDIMADWLNDDDGNRIGANNFVYDFTTRGDKKTGGYVNPVSGQEVPDYWRKDPDEYAEVGRFIWEDKDQKHSCILDATVQDSYLGYGGEKVNIDGSDYEVARHWYPIDKDESLSVTLKANSNKQVSYTSESSQYWFVFGNPFMSRIDVLSFMQHNKDVIKYLKFVDTERTDKAIANEDGTYYNPDLKALWKLSTDGKSLEGIEGQRYIAPMQSVFLCIEESNCSKADSILSATVFVDQMDLFTEKDVNSQKPSGATLTTTVRTTTASARMLIMAEEDVACEMMIDDEVRPGLMVFGLAPQGSRLQGYQMMTVVDEIPLGIIVDGQQDVTLTFEANATWDISEWSLVDNATGLTYPLDEDVLLAEATSTVGRYSLRRSALLDDEAESMYVEIEEGVVTVHATSEDVTGLELHDLQGRRLATHFYASPQSVASIACSRRCLAILTVYRADGAPQRSYKLLLK